MASEGPTAEKHGINPLELARDAIEEAFALAQTGQMDRARSQFRQRLESILRYMCPICGKTGDHETADHRFVGVHQKELHG